MNIDISKIVTKNDFENNVDLVFERAASEGKLVVFDENKPKYILIDFNEYEKLYSNSLDFKEKNEKKLDVNDLLNAIGKKIFIDYYYIFRDDDSAEEKLPYEFTLNSRRSRSSNARRLFKEDMNIEALEIILKSNRIDDETMKRARDIYRKETGDNYYSMNSDNNNEVKIGKLARTIITSFIEEKIIDINEINRLQSADYSKRVFNMNYPILKEVTSSNNKLDMRFDDRGYSRYYSRTVSYYGKTYLLCSQWVENLHRDSLERWIEAQKRKSK